METELTGMLPCKRIAVYGELPLHVQPCACLRCHTWDQTNQPLGAGNWQWNHRTSSLAALKLSWGLLLSHQATEIQKCQRWRETFQGKIRRQRSRWTWSASLFTDTSGTHLQTSERTQDSSWEWAGVPNQWKRIYRTTQNPRSRPEPLEWEH